MRGAVRGLRRALNCLPWSELRDLDVDSATEKFYDLVNAAIADYVPTVRLGTKYPPWFDRDVRCALRDKEAAFKRKKSDPSPENFRAFSLARSAFKSLSNSKYRDYLTGLVHDFRETPKRFWSFIKSVKSSSHSSPTLEYEGVSYSGDYNRAVCFSKCFSRKFSDSKIDSLPLTPMLNVSTLCSFHVPPGKVERLLLELDRHKACGPDDLSARILRECAREIAVPLEILCRLSVEQGVFPSRWKQANVVPVHKKGDKRRPENYRPVSLLPLCSKVLEKVVYDCLMSHCRPVLPLSQHGFLSNRSCVTNLTCFMSDVWGAIAEGKQTDVIYTDFSSAFTSVNHELLLYKLNKSFNVTGLAYNWLHSYLSDRKQRVVVNGKQSTWTPVLSGVPEGSVCSSLLFACYTADIPLHVKHGCTMYADDIKLHKMVHCEEDVHALQADINALVDWSRAWNLHLNPVKCHVITFTLRTSPVLATYKICDAALERCTQVRDLGVVLDSKLTFAGHVDATVAKAKRMVGLLIRSMQRSAVPRRARVSFKPLLYVFYAHVRSIIEYGSVVWSGAAVTHLKRLERIQHTFLIWLACSSDTRSQNLSYDHLLQHFNVPSIKSRLMQHDLMFLYGVFHGRIDCPQLLHQFQLSTPVRRNRSPALWHVPFARVATIKNGTFCRIPSRCNEVLRDNTSLDFFYSPISVYKASVRLHAARAGFY